MQRNGAVFLSADNPFIPPHGLHRGFTLMTYVRLHGKSYPDRMLGVGICLGVSNLVEYGVGTDF